MFTVGYHTNAQAANLLNISDTLSTSEPSVTSAHTVAFTIPPGSDLAATNTVTISFDPNFTDVGTVVSGDVTLTVNGGAATFSAFATTTDSISFTSDTAGNAGEEIVVAIADGKIVNPALISSFEISVNTATDSGNTRVAVVNTVLVTAIVPTTLDFIITGTATGTIANGDATTGSTTATTIPFGELDTTGATSEVLAQRLSVSTNARNGFVVTVEQDDNLQSSTGAIIDSFTDGTYVNTPVAWALPGGGTPTIGDDTTWGHWGLTSSDADLNSDEFGTALYVAASTTPRIIFSHASSSDGLTDFIGSTTVGYRIQITSLQEAGDDYQAILTYIATPTF